MVKLLQTLSFSTKVVFSNLFVLMWTWPDCELGSSNKKSTKM